MFIFHQDNSNCKWKVSLYFLHLFSCTRYHPACSLQICNVHKQNNGRSFYGSTRQIFSDKISSFLEFAQMRLVCSKYPPFTIMTMALCCNIFDWMVLEFVFASLSELMFTFSFFSSIFFLFLQSVFTGCIKLQNSLNIFFLFTAKCFLLVYCTMLYMTH